MSDESSSFAPGCEVFLTAKRMIEYGEGIGDAVRPCVVFTMALAAFGQRIETEQRVAAQLGLGYPGRGLRYYA